MTYGADCKIPAPRNIKDIRGECKTKSVQCAPIVSPFDEPHAITNLAYRVLIRQAEGSVCQGGQVSIGMRLEPEVLGRLHEFASHYGLTVSQLAEGVLEELAEAI